MKIRLDRTIRIDSMDNGVVRQDDKQTSQI